MKELLYAKAIYDDAERAAVNRVLSSDWLSGHKETAEFENELARWWGVKHALAVNSGSSANFIALQALGLEEGSEMITPAGGAFPTTVSPMVYLHHTPVFIDCDLSTLCLDLDEAEKAITPQTKAIVFAHTLGRMPDMARLMSIARKYNLKVLEDCSDAVGSEQGGKKAGTFGDVATTSFYPAHHMTTGGEGGAILTNSDQLYWKAHSIRDWGRACRCGYGRDNPVCKDRFGHPPFDHRYYYTNIGMNLKMTEMQAAFGREQLKRLDEFIELRRRNYKILAGRLLENAWDAGSEAFITRDTVRIPSGISPFAYPILTPNAQAAQRKLEGMGVQTRSLFTGNILAHPAFADIKMRIVGELPNSTKLLKESFFVGVGPHLSIEDMNYLADCLGKVLYGKD